MFQVLETLVNQDKVPALREIPGRSFAGTGAEQTSGQIVLRAIEMDTELQFRGDFQHRAEELQEEFHFFSFFLPFFLPSSLSLFLFFLSNFY